MTAMPIFEVAYHVADTPTEGDFKRIEQYYVNGIEVSRRHLRFSSR